MVYFLNLKSGEISEYDDLYDCLTDIIDENFIKQILNECYSWIDLPIIGKQGVGDIIEAFNALDAAIDSEIEYWFNEIGDELRTEDCLDFNDGKISYNKEVLLEEIGE